MAPKTESMVLCATEPLSPARVKEVLVQEESPVETALIKRAFDELLTAWNDPERGVGRGLKLVEISGGLQLRTEAASASYLRRFLEQKPQRLSRAALEALSIIAYRQPVTRPQIDEIRGVDSSGAVKNLLDRKLVRVLGKSEDVGRPLIYGTTKLFLEFFGLSGLRDLPTLRELHEIEGSPDGTNVVRPEVERPDPKAGPVKVMDLFDSEKGPRELVSEQTETEGEAALRALEQALGEATTVQRRAQHAADTDGEVPEEFRQQRQAESESESASEAEADAEAGGEGEGVADVVPVSAERPQFEDEPTTQMPGENAETSEEADDASSASSLSSEEAAGGDDSGSGEGVPQTHDDDDDEGDDHDDDDDDDDGVDHDGIGDDDDDDDDEDDDEDDDAGHGDSGRVADDDDDDDDDDDVEQGGDGEDGGDEDDGIDDAAAHDDDDEDDLDTGTDDDAEDEDEP